MIHILKNILKTSLFNLLYSIMFNFKKRYYNIAKQNLFNLKNELKYPDSSKYKKSFSQCGEDLIVQFLFDRLKIYNPTYMDIGAYHPFLISNTALFHLKGSKGINIEPNAELYKLLVKSRPCDINLNIGISNLENELRYYCFTDSAWNTFCKDEADKCVKNGLSIIGIEKIKTYPLSYILEKYSNNIFPQFISIDSEGLDEVILQSINFNNNYPLVICVETLSYAPYGNSIKNYNLIKFLENQGYMLYADTNINSIFMRKGNWIKV